MLQRERDKYEEIKDSPDGGKQPGELAKQVSCIPSQVREECSEKSRHVIEVG